MCVTSITKIGLFIRLPSVPGITLYINRSHFVAYSERTRNLLHRHLEQCNVIFKMFSAGDSLFPMHRCVIRPVSNRTCFESGCIV